MLTESCKTIMTLCVYSLDMSIIDITYNLHNVHVFSILRCFFLVNLCNSISTISMSR